MSNYKAGDEVEVWKDGGWHKVKLICGILHGKQDLLALQFSDGSRAYARPASVRPIKSEEERPGNSGRDE